MTRNNNFLFILLIATMAMFGCDSKGYYDTVHNFENETWHKDSAVVFDFNIVDSTQIFNVYINNRNTGQYKYSNLYLFVTTQLPNNQMIKDTLECILADQSGKWLGKGFGNIWSNKVMYRKNVRFPYAGQYQIELKQAMRDDELDYILDAGIRLELVN